jgi:hypothetical protein
MILTTLRDVFPGVPLVESPLFPAMIDDLHFTPEERGVAVQLHERGYAVIDFPDDELDSRVARIKDFLGPYFDANMADLETIKTSGHVQRVQDGWLYNEDIRAIACNGHILKLLSNLYGRAAFPFQTLNFPVGTQQHLHSDSIHFSSIPERFMCGVWVALEDVHLDAGPLTYLPGSHKWPILTNCEIGRRGYNGDRGSAQAPFERAWDALVQTSRVEQEIFLARRGQTLIWAANLLHGGSPQSDATRTRWSQVTHYYFEDCIYYTPAFSDEPLGLLDLRDILDVGTGVLKPNLYFGERVLPERAAPSHLSFGARLRKRIAIRAELPNDFDAEIYYRLNPDVAVANVDAVGHYLQHGKAEGRRYRFRTG